MFHAFFKSSLFLSTGNLIHYLRGCQDSRRFGSMGASQNSKLLFLMSRLRLSGFPFSLGFYSKDTILGAFGFGSIRLIGALFIVGCLFTVSYSVRLFYIGFFLYPSFPSRVSFELWKYFYFSVVSLFTRSVFIGNFFFSRFFPPLTLRGVDFFVGLLIILRGILFFSLNLRSYRVSLITRRITFLSILRSIGISKNFKILSFSKESKWGEVIGGKGILSSFKILSTLVNRLYSVYFTHLIVLWVLLLYILLFFQ